ncbi:MAG: hypothetical protein ACK56I_25370, partial [bacterium]
MHTLTQSFTRIRVSDGKSQVSIEALKWVEKMGDFEYLKHSLARYYDRGTASLPDVRARKTAVLAAKVEYIPPEQCELQTVRSVTDFLGKPYYDNVTVKIGPHNHYKYAQLRLIFTAFHPVEKCEQKLAFIRL